MDRQAVVDEIFFGQSVMIDSYIPPQHPLYNPDVRHYDFDVAAGRALLEEVGWVDDDADPTLRELPRMWLRCLMVHHYWSPMTPETILAASGWRLSCRAPWPNAVYR